MQIDHHKHTENAKIVQFPRVVPLRISSEAKSIEELRVAHLAEAHAQIESFATGAIALEQVVANMITLLTSTVELEHHRILLSKTSTA